MKYNPRTWRRVLPAGIAAISIIAIVSLFLITKGSTQRGAELAYTDVSSATEVAGSVVPASCDSNDWRGSYCPQGVTDLADCHNASAPKISFCPTEGLSCSYFSTAYGVYAHSGSHFANDCTTACPGGVGTYDPFNDPEASTCPSSIKVVFARDCPLPWGGAIVSGQSVNAYLAASASTCTYEVRTCSDGTLSGSYTNKSCTRTTTGTGGGGGCFVAGTRVTMADGTYKNIEEVQIGDFLMSPTGPVRVEKRLVREYGGDIYAFNGDNNYFVTPNHPFMTTNGWESLDPETSHKEIPELSVSQLNIGDTLILEGGKKLRLEKLDKRPVHTTVYNFQLDGSHEYYADGFLVHNKVAF